MEVATEDRAVITVIRVAETDTLPLKVTNV